MLFNFAGDGMPSPVISVVIPERVLSAKIVREEKGIRLASMSIESRGRRWRPWIEFRVWHGARASRRCGERSPLTATSARTKVTRAVNDVTVRA